MYMIFLCITLVLSVEITSHYVYNPHKSLHYATGVSSSQRQLLIITPKTQSRSPYNQRMSIHTQDLHIYDIVLDILRNHELNPAPPQIYYSIQALSTCEKYPSHQHTHTQNV